MQGEEHEMAINKLTATSLQIGNKQAGGGQGWSEECAAAAAAATAAAAAAAATAAAAAGSGSARHTHTYPHHW